MTYDRNRNLGCVDDDDCIGGFRQVTEAYVERHAAPRPVPHPTVGLTEPPEELTGFALDEWRMHLDVNRRHVAHDKSMRVSAANSSYPCHVCNPDQFLRWTEGDWPYPKPKRGEPDDRHPGGNRPPPLTDDDAPDDDGLFDPRAGVPDVDRLTEHEHARADLA